MLSIKSIKVGIVGTNCYIVSDPETRAAAVIDPGDRAKSVLRLADGLDVAYIFLTHGHFDHIIAMDEVRRATGAKTVIHEADAEYLRDSSLSCPSGFPNPAPTEADILTREGEVFNLGKYTFEVLHTPGHTPGSICLRVVMPEENINGGKNILFTGDTLFEGDCGRCDLPGGDYGLMLSSLRRLASLEGDYIVYPGHDVSTTLSAERRRLL